MTEREVIKRLKREKAMPAVGAAERCIGALPEIKKTRGILPLIRLQLFSLPPAMYLVAAAMLLAQQRLLTALETDIALAASGLLSALICLLLTWHLTLSSTESMEDIERCCKYSYGQILLSRILCLCILTLTALLAAAIPGMLRNVIVPGHILITMLPTAFGALAAIGWANYRGNSDTALMSVYLVTATIVSMNLEIVRSAGILTAAVLLAIVLSALVFQTKSIMNRRLQYEAYHY